MSRRGRALLVLVVAVVAAAVAVRLGVWQLDRAAHKLARQAALAERGALPPLAPADLAAPGADAAAIALQQHRRVVVAGRWLPERTVYLANRQMAGRTGFFALTPLVLDDGSAVLVQRGFVARDNDDLARIALPPLPRERVTVHGRMAPEPSRLLDFGAVESGPIRQNLDLDRYAREIALPLRPLTIVQDDGPAPPADGLLRRWPQPDAGVHTHYGYAFQWFALAALIAGLYVWYQLVRPRRRAAR